MNHSDSGALDNVQWTKRSMDDDLWRADGSFRGMSGGGGGGGGKGKGGKGGGGGNPQFTRVIPQFLRKYQQPPEIQAKFAPPPMPDGDDADDHELDDVQRAAIDEYLAKQKKKKQKKEEEEEKEKKKEGEKAESGGADDAEHKEARRKKVMQSVAELGKAGKDAVKGKKRKRSSAAPAKLNNKKLLSFSMDDEE